jgi:hypothetical protein
MDDPTHADAAMNAKKKRKEEKRRKSVAKDFRDTVIKLTCMTEAITEDPDSGGEESEIMGEMSSEV